MNIFILDQNQEKAARYHVDKHVVKMPLETAQMLSTACRKFGIDAPYKMAFVNHPCSIWARESLDNFEWLIELGLQICKEYTYRYNKIHKCQSVINFFVKNKPPINKVGLTPFAQAMPQYLKNIDAVKAYRKYYQCEKKHLFSWKNREKPCWLK